MGDPYRQVQIVDGNGNAVASTSGAVAQGSTTSGQSGNLDQGAVTTAAPSYSTGQTSPLSLDTTGNLRTTVPVGAGSGWTYKTYTAGTGAQVKGSAGTFHSIIVNTSVAGATITIYDSLTASGTKIATITLPSTAVVGPILYDVAFTTGLFVVPSTTTDLTVAYI